MAAGKLSLEIRSDPEVFFELATWWNDQPGALESPFLRAEWFHAWATTRLEESDRLQVFVVGDASSPRAALAMVRKGVRLRSMAAGVSHVFDIVHDGNTDATTMLLDRLRRETRVLFQRVPRESPLATLVTETPGWEIRRSLSSPYVDLTEGFDTVMSMTSTSLKRNVRRGLRRLQETGEVQMTPAVAAASTPGVLREAIELEARGWKGSAGVALASSPAKVRFFERINELAVERNWLRLASLTVDGRLVGFNYDLEYGGRLFGLFTSYDESMDNRSSIGAVLFSQLLEHAAARGIHSYEMGGDSSNEWKMMWTSKTRSLADINGFGANLGGRVARGLSRLRSGSSSGS